MPNGVKIIYFLMAWATFCMLMTVQVKGADWRSDFNGRDNGSCCGEEDCWPVNARVVEDNGGDTLWIEILTNGVTMDIRDFPRNSFHASQDTQAWACHPYYIELESEAIFRDAVGNDMTGADAMGQAFNSEICNKQTTNPDCINCIFISPGS